MAGIILNSQMKNSQALLGAPDKIHALNYGAPKSVPQATAIKQWIRQANANAPFTFGQWVETWILPSDGHVHDIAVDFQLGALTTGNYCNYPAMSLPTQVQILDGSEVIHQYDYRQVMKT